MKKLLVPIAEHDLARYMRMQTLADLITDYITLDGREAEDFEMWCYDHLGAADDVDVRTLDERHLNHIFGQILLYRHLSGYDIAPYCLSTELLEKEGLV